MSKKANLIFMAGVLVVFAVFLAAESADAFCVYNWTDDRIRVQQSNEKGWTWLSAFGAELNPGEKACCNWTNKDCNKKGKRDSEVAFDVYMLDERSLCHNVTIPAGGYVLVKGKNGVYNCEGHGY